MKIRRFREWNTFEKVHFICLFIILSIFILSNIGRIFYIKNMKENIRYYEVIDAECFDKDTNVEHIFVYGKLSAENSILYNEKEYIMIRNINVQYDWDEKPDAFETKNGVLYEKEILDDRYHNTSYTTKYATNITFGNMEISENDLSKFNPYIIDKNWNDIEDRLEFVSALNSEQDFIMYIDSVEYGSINGIQVYQNMNEAREDLIPGFWTFFLLSILVGTVIELLSIMINFMIIEMCSI